MTLYSNRLSSQGGGRLLSLLVLLAVLSTQIICAHKGIIQRKIYTIMNVHDIVFHWFNQSIRIKGGLITLEA